MVYTFETSNLFPVENLLQEDHTANPSQKAPATGVQVPKYELLGAILTQTIIGAMLVLFTSSDSLTSWQISDWVIEYVLRDTGKKSMKNQESSS